MYCLSCLTVPLLCCHIHVNSWGEVPNTMQSYSVLTIASKPLTFKSFLMHSSQSSWDGLQGYRVQQLVYTYFYRHVHDFEDAYIDMYAYFFLMFFKVLKFQNFAGSYNVILFKNLLLYRWPLIYLFVLGRERFPLQTFIL